MAEYLFRTFEIWVAHTNVRNHPQSTHMARSRCKPENCKSDPTLVYVVLQAFVSWFLLLSDKTYHRSLQSQNFSEGPIERFKH
jgi:hypothetical protein